MHRCPRPAAKSARRLGRSCRRHGELPSNPDRAHRTRSQLSALGLPTLNVFTGGHDHHFVREWASLQEMPAAAATVVRIAGAWMADDLVAAAAAGHLSA